MSLVSIIVPVYVGTFLRECLDSIVNQTYKNLEIILIDDGSVDNSFEICDEYAKRDCRIVIVHKQNGGQSSARNAGLDIATGDYIVFVDGDDWLECNAIEVALRNIEDSGADMIWYGMRIHHPGRIENVKPAYGMTIKDAIYYFTKERLIFSVCDKMYRKSLWNKLRFSAGVLFEDVCVTAEMLMSKINVFTISDCLYNYRRVDNYGSTISKMGENPRYWYFKFNYEYSLCMLFAEKKYDDLYHQYIMDAMHDALKSCIVNMAVECLNSDEKRKVEEFLDIHYCDRNILPLEYRIYYWSYKHCYFYNFIKSLDYRFRYRSQ